MIAKFLFTKIFRWELEGIFPAKSKMLLAVGPHTHWFDFILAILVRSFLKEPIHFLGKIELFNPITNRLFRYWGGVPVDRTGKNNTVQQAINYFKINPVFRLAIAPEGTRKKVNQFKSGFYYIAHTAQIPILPVVFDFGKRKMILHPLYYTTGDKEKDVLQIEKYFKGIRGKIPKYSFNP